MAGGLASEIANWNSQGLGIQVMTLLLNNQSGGPADAAGALTWRDNFSLTEAYVAADNSFSMVPAGQSSIGTPMLTVIDPRTMTVVLVQQGWGGSHPPELTQTASANR
ncbi:MAG: hypothetical protein AAGA56_11365 [Myxococcota bacterium]